MGATWEYLRFGAGYRRGGRGDGRFRALVGLTSLHTRIRARHLLRHLTEDGWRGPVLEVGFGDGYLLLALARRYPRFAFEGWEVEAEKVAAAQARARAAGVENVTFLRADVNALPAAELAPRFACVYCVDVLEHIPDDAEAVRRMAGLLVPGGRLVVHVPLRRSRQRRFFPGFGAHSDPGHVREEYTPEELAALVARAGLRLASVAYTFGAWGEFAFEANSLCWRWRRLDSVWRALTLPFLLPAGLWDRPSARGNSLLLTAVADGVPHG